MNIYKPEKNIDMGMGMVTHEVIVRYSLADVSIDVFSFVQICVQDKCVKLEKAKARALFRRALQNLEEESEEEIGEEEEEIRSSESEPWGGGGFFCQTF